MTGAPTLLTVILNYRSAGMTLDAARTALREMAGLRGEIVIVDNDSQDGSFETMTATVAAEGWGADGRVRVIQAGRNGGFGAGNNVGIRAGLSDGTAPDYYYILNPDAFPDPGAVRALLDHLEGRAEAGMAGSYIHGPDGEPHVTAFRFPTIWSEFEGAAATGPISRILSAWIVAPPLPETTCSMDWVAGASLMVKRAVFEQIGLFDEAYFLYFDETDFCRRAAKARWTVDYVRESSVTHIGSVSTGMKSWERTPRYWFDSRLRYFAKHHGRPYAAAATMANVTGALLLRARRLIERKPVDAPARFLGDLIAHAGATLPARTLQETVPRLYQTNIA
jgi:N-acetylglucosaminyl-diphospho-decaprenol L-rhamnosyltransferase